MASVLDYLFGPSTASINAAKADLEDAREHGRYQDAGAPAYQAALHALLGADAKARNPLAGDMPLSMTGRLPGDVANTPGTAPAPAPQGGAWSDVEDEAANRAQAGGLRAPVLEAWGLVPKPKVKK